MTQTPELHPLCTLFPRLAGKEFDALVADVHNNGLREPITLHDDMILDGGNRYRACLAAGIEPRYKKFSGDNLVTFVLSANLHRRHMSPGQQAAIVAAAQDWAKAQTHGGDRRSSAHVSTCSDTTKTRAETSGASLATQRRADAVAKADPKLARKVATGETSLGEAVKKVAPQLAPRATKPVEKPEPDDGPTLAELVDELQRENEELRGLIKASEADDLKAEAIKWKRVAEHSKREQGVAMDAAAKCQDREKFIVRMLRRCGKAVGVKDPNHTDPRDIVKAVEAFAQPKAKRNAT